MIKAALIAVLLACTPVLWAQVYSWQDEQGRTHYSDKPLDAKARQQSLDIGGMPDVRVLDAVVTPEFDDTYVSPVVGDVAYRLNETDRLAYFYFGGDCVSPTRLDYSELNQRYHHALPQADDLRRVLAAVLQRSFSRGVKNYAHHNAAIMPDNASPYIQAEIIEMRIYACAPVLPKQIPGDALSAFSMSMFKHSHVWLKVNWFLISRQTGETLAIATTEGVNENRVTESGRIPNVVTQAFREASTRVLSEQAVIDKLQRSLRQASPFAPMPKPHAESLVPQGYENLLVNANLAKVLTSLSQLRYRLAGYFAEHNEWPVSLDEIDQHEQSLAATGMVSSLELRYAGALHVNLNDSVFPTGHVLQMLPTWDAGSGQILWECRTTVKSTLSACESY